MYTKYKIHYTKMLNYASVLKLREKYFLYICLDWIFSDCIYITSGVSSFCLI